MEENLTIKLNELIESLQKVQTIHDLNNIKSQYLGKKSEISEFMTKISSLDIETKKESGKLINNFKEKFNNLIEEKRGNIISFEQNFDFFDPTLPNKSQKVGKKHILSHTIDELRSIMSHLGFSFVSAGEIEDDFHNFTALNVPLFHPARQSNDTLYVDGGLLLRTQTSTVQIRHMEKHKPPHYIASIGKVYRADDVDQTHLPMFHQMECLCIDENITVLQMKNTIQNMLKMFFLTDDIPMRFRSSYFPFTEPSMEIDIKMGNKWLEIMGCGMVHRNVLKNVNIDEKYQGFALGMGVERLAMLKYNITDIRGLVEGDIKWLQHYGI